MPKKPRIVVTRPAHQADGLVESFSAAGFPVARLPLLEVTGPADPAPLNDAVGHLPTFDTVVFTSANAVGPFVEAMRSTGAAPGDLPPRLRVAVVGPATAAAARAAGLPVHLQAARADAEGLVEALAAEQGDEPGGLAGGAFLLPQAADARPTLGEGLTAAGARVTAVVAYDKCLPPDAPKIAADLFTGQPLGWVTFTSPRIVRHFVELMEGLGGWQKRRSELSALSIGPVTTAELRHHGIEPAAEASQPGDAAMVEAVVRALDTPSP